jgi:hypothetical protein
VPSVTFNTSIGVCLSVFVRHVFFLAPDLRTDGRTVCSDWTEGNWNILSIRDIRTWRLYIDIVLGDKMTSFITVRPYIQISILARGPGFETWLQQDFCHFVKKWLVSWTDGLRTYWLTWRFVIVPSVMCILLY